MNAEQLFCCPPSPVSTLYLASSILHLASLTVHRQSSVLNIPLFSRAPKRPPSPVPGLRSATVYPASCIVHGPSSIVNCPFSTFHPPIFPSPIIRDPLSTSNLQPSTFNRWHLILGKVNSNNKSEQFPAPPLFSLFAPDSGPRGRQKERIEPYLARFFPKQLAPRME
jgi:hypothetical protein